MSHRTRIIMLGAITVAAGIAVALLPRMPQSLDYHNFADQRTFLGVPNFLNVVSNLPFLLAGVWGLIVVMGPSETAERRFVAPVERLPYLILAVGVALTCFGSAYYHLAPGNARLVWDRLPMTLGFMSLLSAMLMERVNLRAGLVALGPLLLLGLASVVALVRERIARRGRFAPLHHGPVLHAASHSPPALAFPRPLHPRLGPGGGHGVLRPGENFRIARPADFLPGTRVSGHTLKHLAAAAGVYWIFRMLARRRPVVPVSG